MDNEERAELLVAQYGFDFEKATELSKFLFFSEYTNSLKNYFMLLWLKKNRLRRSYNSSKVTYLLNV